MLHITPEDSATKSCCKMMSFINKDNYLHPAHKMHCILLFIDNIGYADCLQGLVGEIDLSDTPYHLHVGSTSLLITHVRGHFNTIEFVVKCTHRTGPLMTAISTEMLTSEDLEDSSIID